MIVVGSCRDIVFVKLFKYFCVYSVNSKCVRRFKTTCTCRKKTCFYNIFADSSATVTTTMQASVETNFVVI